MAYLEEIQNVIEGLNLISEYSKGGVVKQSVDTTGIYKNRRYFNYYIEHILPFNDQLSREYTKTFGTRGPGRRRYWGEKSEFQEKVEHFMDYANKLSPSAKAQIKLKAIAAYTQRYNLSPQHQAQLAHLAQTHPDAISDVIDELKKHKYEKKEDFAQQVSKELEKYQRATGKEVKYVEKERSKVSKEDQIKIDTDLNQRPEEEKKPVVPEGMSKEGIVLPGEVKTQEPTPELQNLPGETRLESGIVLPAGVQPVKPGEIALPPQKPAEPTPRLILTSRDVSSNINEPKVYFAGQPKPGEERKIHLPASVKLSPAAKQELSAKLKDVGVVAEVAEKRSEPKVRKAAGSMLKLVGRQLMAPGGGGNVTNFLTSPLNFGKGGALFGKAAVRGTVFYAIIIFLIFFFLLFFMTVFNGNSNLTRCPPWQETCNIATTTPSGPGQNANVSITKRGPSHVGNGEEIKYELVVVYNGTGTGNVQVFDKAPDGTTLKDVSDGGTKDGQTARWTLSNMVHGQGRTLSFSVQPTRENFWAVNNAQAQAAPNGGTEPTGPIQITKSADKAQYNVNDNIQYTLAVKASSLAGANVTIKDHIPTNTTFVSADSAGHLDTATGQVVWDLNATHTAPTNRVIPPPIGPEPPGVGRPVQRITATVAQLQADIENHSDFPDVKANAAHYAQVLYDSGVGNGQQDQLVDPALLAAMWFGETHYSAHGAYVNNPFSICFISEGALGGMHRGINNGLCGPGNPWATWDTFDQGLSAMAENIRTRYYTDGQTDTWTIHSGLTGEPTDHSPQYHCRCHVGPEFQIKTWNDYVNFYYGYLNTMDRITGGSDFALDTTLHFTVKPNIDRIRVTNQAQGFAPGVGDSQSNSLTVRVGDAPNGVTIALDPGHSNPDLTPEGKSSEGALNFEVATRLKEKLASQGINAVLTRDTVALPLSDQYENLLSRNHAINQANACFFVAIHFDANDYHGAHTGARGYINLSRTFTQTSERIATTIAQSLAASTGIPSNRNTQSDLEAGACANHRIVPLYVLGKQDAEVCNSTIKEATQIPGTEMEFFTLARSYDSIRTDEDMMNKIVTGYANGISQLAASDLCASGTQPPQPPNPGPVTPTTVTRGNQGNIALTFDLGEGQYGTGGWTQHMHDNTKKILDDLKARGVHATFFPTGAFLEDPNNEDLVRQIAADGHEFGNHTYNHISATGQVDGRGQRLPASALVEQINHTETIMNQKFGFTTKPYFRFPFFDGATDPEFNNAIAQAGYYNIFWTNCTPRRGNTGPAIEDQPLNAANSQAYIDNLTTDARCITPGSQIVVHGYPDLTTANIGTVIDILKSKGLEVTTVSNFWRAQ
jgi:uncharacterized repeat protein (TIGR01451 family)